MTSKTDKRRQLLARAASRLASRVETGHTSATFPGGFGIVQAIIVEADLLPSLESVLNVTSCQELIAATLSVPVDAIPIHLSNAIADLETANLDTKSSLVRRAAKMSRLLRLFAAQMSVNDYAF